MVIKKLTVPVRLLKDGSHDAIRTWTWGMLLGLRGVSEWPGHESACGDLDLKVDELDAAMDELEMMGWVQLDRETGKFAMICR